MHVLVVRQPAEPLLDASPPRPTCTVRKEGLMRQTSRQPLGCTSGDAAGGGIVCTAARATHLPLLLFRAPAAACCLDPGSQVCDIYDAAGSLESVGSVRVRLLAAGRWRMGFLMPPFTALLHSVAVRACSAPWPAALALLGPKCYSGARGYPRALSAHLQTPALSHTPLAGSGGRRGAGAPQAQGGAAGG